MRPNGEGRAWKGAGVWPPPPFAMAAEREHRLMQTHLTLLCSRGSDHVPPSVRRWLSELPSHADVLLPAGGVLLSWQLLVYFPLWAWVRVRVRVRPSWCWLCSRRWPTTCVPPLPGPVGCGWLVYDPIPVWCCEGSDSVR
jgi:hypothetical protein